MLKSSKKQLHFSSRCCMMDATAGLEIKGEQKPVGDDEQAGHLCKDCVDGELSFKLEIKASVELLKHFEVEATLASYTKKIADFYWSLTYGEFGWGDCPHVDTGGGGSGAWNDGSHGERIDSGDCGEAVKWELFANGTLHIYGSGAMSDYYGSGTGTPWYNMYEKITATVIDSGITTIGSNAFRNCTSLTSVSIPGSVATIGAFAFRNCDGLTNMTIPNGVTTIGDSALFDCDGLTSVTIPNSVTAICGEVFAHCGHLTSVTIPDSVITIGNLAFYRCDRLTKVVFQGSAPELSDNTFYGTITTANYPAGDATWTDAVKQDYGGIIIWVPYTGTPPVAEAPVLLSAPRSAAPRAAALTASAQLEPNQRYLLVVAKDGSAPDLLAASNLLFCDQQCAGETGAVSFSYLPSPAWQTPTWPSTDRRASLS